MSFDLLRDDAPDKDDWTLRRGQPANTVDPENVS